MESFDETHKNKWNSYKQNLLYIKFIDVTFSLCRLYNRNVAAINFI